MKSTPLEQCDGKTLSGSVFHLSDQYLLLVWSDGCVTELYSEGDEEDSIISTCSRHQDICFDGYDHDRLIEAGIDSIFVEGLKQTRLDKEAQILATYRENRRLEYEKLKKEFEGT